MSSFQIRTAVRGIGMTIGIWAFLAVLAEWQGAVWPHRTVNAASCFNMQTLQFIPAQCTFIGRNEAWFNFLLFTFVVEFLWLKSWMMGALTVAWDWLGVSLIAANLAFSLVYLYVMTTTLFPTLTHNRIPTYCLRGLLLVTLIFGLVQLIRVQDPSDDAWQAGDPDRRSGFDRRQTTNGGTV